MLKQILINTVIILGALAIRAQPNYPTDHSNAQLNYNDLDNFLKAYEQLNESSDTVSVLAKYYFENASPGLLEYMDRHSLTAKKLAASMNDYPVSYKNLAAFRGKIPDFEKMFREEMKVYQDAVRDVMFPPTYLLVGAHKGIAQASPKGQLITIEKVSDQPERLAQVISHELTHFQQAKALGFQNYVSTYSEPDNMLDLILREGGAEFVSYYLVGNSKGSYRNESYYETNEQSLKSRFLQDLKVQDQSFWLWESLNQTEIPTLLGYTIGYRICKSYYERAHDKDQALKDILAISNDEAFLIESKYFEPAK